MNITDEQVPYILNAVEHYAAYMKATARDERPYLEITDSLKKKRQSTAEPETSATKKKRAYTMSPAGWKFDRYPPLSALFMGPQERAMTAPTSLIAGALVERCK